MQGRIWMVIALSGVLCAGVALGQKAEGERPSAGGKTVVQDDRVSAEDVRAMRADVQRMRALIMQMQNNLGSVTSTTTPLKHQFELEIEMWQVAVGDMDRRLARAESQQRQKEQH